MALRYIAYYRVSTKKQGKSGLGLEAQQSAVRAFMRARPGDTLAGEFTDIESGKKNDRPELQKALAACSKTGATLLIAKLDRLSRNAAFLFALRDQGTKFVACDMPFANELVVGVMAVLAQQEREWISERTRNALAEKKAQGAKLGGNHDGKSFGGDFTLGGKAHAAKADAFAVKMCGPIRMAERAGGSLRQIAERLNTQGIRTPRGKLWSAAGLRNTLLRLDRLGL